MNADRAERLHAAIIDHLDRLVRDAGRTSSDVPAATGIPAGRFEALLAHRAVFTLPELGRVAHVLGTTASTLVLRAEVRLWVEDATTDDTELPAEQIADWLISRLVENGVVAR